MSSILIIEDDPLTLYGVVDLLETENFQVTGVTDGDVALKLVKKKKFDLIICDLLLSNVNGYEVLSALKKNTDTAEIPFIILSGKSKRRDIRLGMEIGANDYITKPFLNQDLIEAIQTQLNPRNFLEKCYETKEPDLEGIENESQDNLLPPDESQNSFTSSEDIALSDTEYLIDKLENSLKKYVEKRIGFCSSSQKTSPSIAVCCISLDRIGNLGDCLNEQEHFAIFKTVTERIYSEIGNKAGIMLLQARDYLITLPYIKTLSEAIELIKLVQGSLSKPFFLGERTIKFTPYAGITFSPDYNQEFSTLLECAQQTVEYAKAKGEDCYAIYQPKIKKSLEFKSLVLVEDLQNAIALTGTNQQLEIYYQPQVDISTGEIVGCEALLRWNHPRQGCILPTVFLSIAEDMGLIESIETWLLNTVCQQLIIWHQRGFGNLKLAINLSGHQLKRDDLFAKIAQTLQQKQVSPQSLVIELTENILLKNSQGSLALLSNLKSLGVQVAIDNFGQGHHALAYLRHLPFDILKVDMCHLNSFFGEKNSQIALKYINKMAQRLNVKLIIEKVETKKQLNFLRRHQFKQAQGYYLSFPLTANKFEQLLSQKTNWLSTSD